VYCTIYHLRRCRLVGHLTLFIVIPGVQNSKTFVFNFNNTSHLPDFRECSNFKNTCGSSHSNSHSNRNKKYNNSDSNTAGANS
jgi:hypothetical protein